MKKQLKIGFVDTCMQEFFTHTLSTRYDLIIDQKNPEFLIFDCADFGSKNLTYSKKNCIKIFHTGENRRAENYDCHYAITSDYTSALWQYRLPNCAMVPFYYSIGNTENSKTFPINHILNTHEIDTKKSKFCAFLHRNPSNALRNSVFQVLNKYKKVDSAGPLFNNMGFTIGQEYDDKLSFIEEYKFVFAFENSSYPGYTTEKIMDAFYVNSVPIYWGSSTIDLDFNEKSFINANNFKTIKELIDYIIWLDNNIEEYNKIRFEPKFKHKIIPTCMRYDYFLNWFDSIVYNKKFMRE